MSSDGVYAYAKACGILGKSYVGKRASLLFGLHSLNDLDRFIFPKVTGSRRELPGRELLHDLENRITERAVSQIYTIVNAYQDPPEILIRMLRAYELSDLKNCIHHIALGKKELPHVFDIGRFTKVKFSFFPDIALMLKNTEYEFILTDLQSGFDITTIDKTSIETKLDECYYNKLLESLAVLSEEDRIIAEQVLADEICLHNCVWALRLRVYYNKTAEETYRFLMDIKLRGRMHKKDPSLAADAISSLELPLDSRSTWHGWRWDNFLNPEEPAVHWRADPRFFQNAASRHLYHLALHLFHRMPLSVSSIFCFIKLKQFEEDLLTSLAEGLSLGMDSAGVFKLLEVTP